MATHDYVIDNSTGANVRADINSVLQAILTNNSSSSAPSTTAAYMFWADTTSGTLKIRNSSDNAWVELLQLDGTLTLEDGSASTPGLAFRDDLNTGIFSSAADTFNVATAGVERMELGATTIFNEDGADVDLRVEGDTDQNLFYVDAGNNRVGIGDSTPSTKLEVAGDVTIANLEPKLFLTDTNNNSDFSLQNANGSFKIFDETNSATRLLIDASGGIVTGGASSPTSSDIGNIYIKNASAIGSVSHQLNVATNAVFNGGWKYIAGSLGATLLAINQSGYFFGTAGSGSAGGDATFTTRFTVGADGDCTVNDGDLVIGTAGHGIDFSAQTATSATGASASSELLDHYEEGTFTPFNPSLTATDLQGHYTRVGRVVHCSIFITIPNNSNGNNFVIDGLPFNTFNPDPSVGSSLQGGYLIYSTYGAPVQIRTNQGGDRIVVNSISGSNIQLTTLDNINFRFGLHYFTT